MAELESASFSPFRPWSHLPKELVEIISGKITNIVDYVRFRSVCTSWRSAAKPTFLPPQLPRLLLPYDLNSSTLSFFSLLTGKLSVFDFPETRNKIISDSSFGWLGLIDATDSSLSLFNPFTRDHIHLPPVSTIPYYQGLPRYLWEAEPDADGIVDESDPSFPWGLLREGYPWQLSLSSNITDDDCVAVAMLYSVSELAYCKIGDETWRVGDRIDESWRVGDRIDSSFCRREGKMYVFDENAGGIVHELPGDKQTVIDPPDSDQPVQKAYWVKLGEEMVMIVFYEPVFDEEGDDVQSQPIGFLKLDERDEERMKWVEAVTSLGEFAIFISRHQLSVVRAADFPGCREDCIYFADVYGSRVDDSEPWVYCFDVFDMKQKKYELMRVPWTKPSTMEEAPGGSAWYAPSLR